MDRRLSSSAARRLGGGAAARRPRGAGGQTDAAIGVLTTLAADDAEAMACLAAFLQALQRFSWIGDRNVTSTTDGAPVEPERIRRRAAELAALAPDVILANGARGRTIATATRLCRLCSSRSRIRSAQVMLRALHAGGNATGFTLFEYGTSGRWLDLLEQITPSVTQAVVLRDPTQPPE